MTRTPSSTAPALHVQALSAQLGRTPVLHDLHFSIPQGQWWAVVGPNGAGKSTLLRSVAGLLPHTGAVRLLGQDWASWGHRERAQAVSWLGQSGAGMDAGADDLTAYDVVMLGRLPHQGWLGAPSPQDHAVVEQALRDTQAWDWACKPLGQLSGGERQRVLLARALAVQAQVLLMDEPLANLDPPHQTDWLRLVRGLVAQGRTVVSVLHEINIALCADQVMVMAQGRLTHIGPSDDPATHAALCAVFEHQISIHRLNQRWVMLPNV